MARTTVLITGANSGVGFATAKVLARVSDTFHIIMASRRHENAQAAKSEIEAAGDLQGTLSTVQLDVTDETSIQEAAAHVQQRFGRLDVLINNAASGSMDPDTKTRFQLCLETNVTGPALVTAAFRHLLLESPNPYSIYVSSGQRTLPRNITKEKPAGHEHIRNGDAYTISKAALNMLVVLEHRDHGGPEGIKVFAVSPGFVRSNLRGTDEEARSGWGLAGDPQVSGEIILGIVLGKRDGDVGCLVHRDGVYPW